jgi:hypothetical protein
MLKVDFNIMPGIPEDWIVLIETSQELEKPIKFFIIAMLVLHQEFLYHINELRHYVGENCNSEQ